jgi:hypothetical protein
MSKNCNRSAENRSSDNVRREMLVVYEATSRNEES